MSARSSRVNAALGALATGMVYLALCMLGLVTILVLAEVVCRNFFDIGLPWADELARFAGISLVFLAIPRLLFDDAHISLELLPGMLSGRAKSALFVVSRLAALAFSVIMLFALYKFLLRAGKFSTPALGIPNLIFYLPAILGFGLFAIITLHKLIAGVDAKATDQEPRS